MLCYKIIIMPKEDHENVILCQGPPRSDENSVIPLDVSSEILVDSMTNMSDTLVDPDLIISAHENPDNEEEITRLTLAYERLEEIPRTITERFGNHLVYLDISHNKIMNLAPLLHFKHLTSLIADNNPITESCVLPYLPKLKLLWLNHCNIASLYPWVGRLKNSCPNLEHISLMGNPAAPSFLNGGTFYEYLQYRLFVISQFPSLTHLDDRRVTEDQRTEALRLYKRPIFESLTAPGSGISQVLRTSVTWSGVQEVFKSMWKERRDNRNLLI